MCGYIVLRKNKNFNRQLFLDSSKLLRNRGPDDFSFFENEKVILVFYRLSIRDITILGRQPMYSQDKSKVIVFNGEIYNSKKLLHLIDKRNIRGTSDTEVLLNLYQKLGPKCLDYIKGMFSFVIYDIKENTFFSARDRFGIKPINYFENENNLIISSETKPILNYIKKIDINYQAFGDFLIRGYMDHDDQTFFKNIKQVEPGHYKIFFPTKSKNICYWSIDSTNKKNNLNLENIKKKLKSLWNLSINEHLESDVKIGTFLSGGTDSSAITHLCKKKLNYNFKTFTYDFSDNTKNQYGESKFAKKFARKNRLENICTTISPVYIKNNFDKTIKILESPFTSVRIFGTKKLYETVRNSGLKVILEGYGGDEMLAGYDYNFLPNLLDSIKNKNNVLNISNKIFSKKNINKFGFEKLINFIYCLNAQGNFTSDGTPYLNFDLFNKDFVTQYFLNINNTYEKKICLPKFDNYLKKSQYFDIKFIHIPRTLKYVDRLSMSSGVEARIPFLDHKLFEFCFNLKNSLKIKNFNKRWIWHETFGTKIQNEEKRTIVDPQRIWFKTFLKNNLIEEIENSSSFAKEIFNKKKILKYLKKYENSDLNTSFNLMQILTTLKFLRVFKSSNFFENK
jgi:asparagine synthase (glutamine-hydrolysing)